jgi:hypothetical protein
LLWNEITASKHDKDGLYYESRVPEWSLEKITDDPASTQLLKDLDTAATVASSQWPKEQEEDVI